MPILNQGSFNVTSLIVPDTFVVIVPPSQLSLNGVPSNIVGMVGLASWGPVNSAVTIGSYAEYVQNFGPLKNRPFDMGTHMAVATGQGASSFVNVRVTDGSDTPATGAFGSNITFTAKYTGTFGNGVSVTVGAGSKPNSFRFTIGASGYIPEIYNNIQATPTTVSTTGTAAGSTTVTVASSAGIATGMVLAGTGVTGSPTVTTITDATHVVVSSSQTIASNTPLTFTAANNSLWQALAAAVNNGVNGRFASNYVTAVAGAGTGTPTLNASVTLSGGTDGDDAVTAATLVGANTLPATGMYCLSSSASILDVCDMTDPTLFTVVDQFANSIQAYAIQQIAAGTTVAAAVAQKQAAGLDSYNTKLMHGDYLYWNDPVTGTVRLVAPQAFVAGRFGNLTVQLTSLNKTIYAVAGSQRNGLVGQGGVSSPYSNAEITSLTVAGIDLVTNPGAGNLAIWTCRHGHNTSSDETRYLDNYPTLTNYIAKTLLAGLGYYIGQTISPTLMVNITATLNFFMQRLTGAGMLLSPDGSTPYNVVCNKTNNPPSQTQLGIVTADVQCVYPSINEKFVVNLQGGNTVTVSLTSASNSQ